MDLTVNVLGDDPGLAISYQAALRELMALQLGNPNPWILLLTTHVDRPTASAAALAPIEGTLLEAIDECPELEEYFADVAENAPGPGTLSTCTDDEFRLFMLSGVMKWLRHLVTGGTVQRRVKVTESLQVG